jgi:hypothetical protein
MTMSAFAVNAAEVRIATTVAIIKIVFFRGIEASLLVRVLNLLKSSGQI